MAKPEEKAGRRKLSVTQVKLSDQDVGFSFKGKYAGIVLGAPFQQVDQKTGEVVQKQLRSVIMENEGKRTAYLADTGLVNGLTEAQVTEGMMIEVVKLEKQKLTKGRTMNQYDIFAL